jgi:hypothetical protein
MLPGECRADVNAPLLVPRMGLGIFSSLFKKKFPLCMWIYVIREADAAKIAKRERGSVLAGYFGKPLLTFFHSPGAFPVKYQGSPTYS